jgi:tetratricopeptide (TPR) repeat protein
MNSSSASLLQQAMAWHNQGRIHDAATVYRRLLAAEPGNPDAMHLLGVALAQMGSPEEAIGLIRAAVRARPNAPMAHNNLGNAFRAARRYAEALESYERATALKPDYIEAHSSAGHMLIALDRPEQALARADRALRLKTDFLDALVCRGIALGKLERHEEALESFDKVIALQPQHADAYYNRGNVLGALRRDDEALGSFERALALQPNYIPARWNSALLKLLRGEWREGWQRYEARFEMDQLQGQGPTRGFSQPRWRGREPLAGKTILLWAERGLGDTIQFSRYASLVRAQGANVVLEVQPPLKGLLGTQFPDVRVIAQGEAIGDFDYHCPLLSLPLAFGTEIGNLPVAVTYLKADAAAVERWARRLPSDTAIRVGIAWQGNLEAERNWARGRSIPLDAFRELAHEPNFRLISLQTGPAAQQLAQVDFRAAVTSFGDSLDGGASAFLDTAAIMMSLDLVITADTSIAHLAGALGVPVWVALHATSEWRWLLDRHDSPWYPSMRLFRQQRIDDWSAVFAAIGAELRQATPKLLATRQSNQASG